MFLLKKIVSVLIFPLTIFLVLLVAGIGVLSFTERQKGGRRLIIVAMILFVLISCEGLPYLLLLPLESQYPSLYESSTGPHAGKYADVKWIIVLSGGHTSSPEIPLSMQPTRMTTVRLVEGIRLLRKYPNAKLLLSGGDYFDKTSDADAMLSQALDLGVNQKDIVLETESKDTEAQAHFIQPIVRNDRCILVTSAAHMVRSMALFREAGMNPIPAPTDYLVKTRGLTPRYFYPNEESLLKTRTAIYEYLGIVWAKMRGKM